MLRLGQVMCNIWINISLSQKTWKTYICLLVWRTRDTLQGVPVALLRLLLKSALGHTAKAQEKSSAIYLYNSMLFLPPPRHVIVASVGWWMTLPSRHSGGSIIMEQVLAWSLEVPAWPIDLHCCLTLSSWRAIWVEQQSYGIHPGDKLLSGPWFFVILINPCCPQTPNPLFFSSFTLTSQAFPALERLPSINSINTILKANCPPKICHSCSTS